MKSISYHKAIHIIENIVKIYVADEFGNIILLLIRVIQSFLIPFNLVKMHMCQRLTF